MVEICDSSSLAKRLTVDSFDDLFDYLLQFEKLVNASRAKKLEKSHDPLALVAHTGSSSGNTSSYYVTHPPSVVYYNEEYEQDDVHNHSEDPLASAMLITPDTPSRISTTITTTTIPNPTRQGMGEVKYRQVIPLPLTGKETASGKTSG
ncbi:hypothetical protein Tco_0865342 [Tanacetum coccineum]